VREKDAKLDLPIRRSDPALILGERSSGGGERRHDRGNDAIGRSKAVSQILRYQQRQPAGEYRGIDGFSQDAAWPWNSSFDGRPASQGIFEPKLDGVLRWEPGIVTAAFNDRISNDRSRRSFSVPTSAALSNESTLVKRGSACRSKARRPRPSPRPCRRCGNPLFATPDRVEFVCEKNLDL